LSTSNVLRLTIQGEDQCDNPCEDNYSFRLKYGGTTLFNRVITPGEVLGAFKAEFLLSGDGASNSQLGFLTYIGDTAATKQGTAAVDATAPQALEVTVDWSLAGLNNTVRVKHAVLELLK